MAASIMPILRQNDLLHLESNLNLYLYGSSSLSDTDNLYLCGSSSFSETNNLYLCGSSSLSDTDNLYLYGSSSFSDTNNLYLYGSSSFSDTNNLYLYGSSCGSSSLSVTNNRIIICSVINLLLKQIEFFNNAFPPSPLPSYFLYSMLSCLYSIVPTVD